MTETTATADPAAHAEDAPHDEHHVHVYPTTGIAEGNAKLPLWFVAVILSLFAFFVGYVAIQWSAQTSSAQPK